MELSPFISWGFLTAFPPCPNMAFWYNMSFTKIQLCSKYFDWTRSGGHRLIKSFWFPIWSYIKFKDFVNFLKKSLLDLHKILYVLIQYKLVFDCNKLHFRAWNLRFYKILGQSHNRSLPRSFNWQYVSKADQMITATQAISFVSDLHYSWA